VVAYSESAPLTSESWVKVSGVMSSASHGPSAIRSGGQVGGPVDSGRGDEGGVEPGAVVGLITVPEEAGA
jgi:hypothetical protein